MQRECNKERSTLSRRRARPEKCRRTRDARQRMPRGAVPRRRRWRRRQPNNSNPTTLLCGCAGVPRARRIHLCVNNTHATRTQRRQKTSPSDAQSYRVWYICEQQLVDRAAGRRNDQGDEPASEQVRASGPGPGPEQPAADCDRGEDMECEEELGHPEHSAACYGKLRSPGRALGGRTDAGAEGKLSAPSSRSWGLPPKKVFFIENLD